MYSDTDIKIAMKAGTITINPFNERQLGTNSYDVCLGNEFFEVFWDSEGPYFVGPYFYRDGTEINLPVAGTLLGMTKERVGTFGKVVAELRSRSSTRRLGITTNCDAGLGDIGYNDYWTLELTGFVTSGFAPPSLVVGEAIAQIVFSECKSEPTKQYDGQYQSDWPLNMIPKKWRHRIREP